MSEGKRLSDAELAEITKRSDWYFAREKEDDERTADSFFNPDGYKAHLDRAALLSHIAALAAPPSQGNVERARAEAAAILRTLGCVPDSTDLSETDAKVSVGFLRRLIGSYGQGTDGACCEAMREAIIKECKRLAGCWTVKSITETNEIGNVPNKRKLKGMAAGALELAHAIRALPLPVSADGRDAVIEECAQICDAEFRLRKSRLDNPDPNFGDPNIQGHKSVTALKLAEKLRALKSKQPSDTGSET